MDINVWFALYGPAGLPEPVANTLSTALTEILGSEQFRQKMQDAGGEVAKPGINAAQFQADETRKYGALVNSAKIEAQ